VTPNPKTSLARGCQTGGVYISCSPIDKLIRIILTTWPINTQVLKATYSSMDSMSINAVIRPTPKINMAVVKPEVSHILCSVRHEILTSRWIVLMSTSAVANADPRNIAILCSFEALCERKKTTNLVKWQFSPIFEFGAHFY
jgi:hypothetical protein